MSIRYRLVLLMFFAISALLAVAVFNAWQSSGDLMAERRLKTRHLVETTHSLLTYWQGRAQSGGLTTDQAQRQAIQAVKALRYEGKEYFWLQDSTQPVPRVLMHPTVPSLDGTLPEQDKFNRATSLQAGQTGDVVRTDGKLNLFTAAGRVARGGSAGYITYDWPKPVAGGGTSIESFPKMSYAMHFAPRNWVVASGIYVDDVDQAFHQHLLRQALITSGAAIVLLLLSFWQSRAITVPLLAAESASLRVVRDRDFTAIVPANGHDEVGRACAAFNDLVTAMRSTLGEIRHSSQAMSRAATTIGNDAVATQRQSGSGNQAVNSMTGAAGRFCVVRGHGEARKLEG